MSAAIVAAFFVLFLIPALDGSQSVTLAWSPVTNSDLAGYNVYYGSVSRIYTNTVSVGNVTNVTVSGLSEGSSYYFAATALSISGLESDFSDEVSYTVPYSPFVLTILTLTNDFKFVGWATNIFWQSPTNSAESDTNVPGWICTTNTAPLYVRTNLNIPVPIRGGWRLWYSTNLVSWAIYTTGTGIQTVAIPIRAPKQFLKLSAP